MEPQHLPEREPDQQYRYRRFRGKMPMITAVIRMVAEQGTQSLNRLLNCLFGYHEIVTMLRGSIRCASERGSSRERNP